MTSKHMTASRTTPLSPPLHMDHEIKEKDLNNANPALDIDSINSFSGSNVARNIYHSPIPNSTHKFSSNLRLSTHLDEDGHDTTIIDRINEVGNRNDPNTTPPNNSGTDNDDILTESAGTMSSSSTISSRRQELVYSNINSALGEPVNFNIAQQSPSRASFDRIAQLPTPVLNNGSFINYSTLSADSSSLNLSPTEGKLDVQKTRSPKHNADNYDSKDPTSGGMASPRVISDYKPIPALGRKNSLLDSSTSSVSKRFVSNPILIQNTTSPRYGTPTPPPSTPPRYLKSIPASSPEESEATAAEHKSKYYEKSFYSARAHKVFRFIREIGSGNFSTVLLAGASEQLVAIKVISVPLESKAQIQNFKSFIRRELSILNEIRAHPCVTTLLDYSLSLRVATLDPYESEDSDPVTDEDFGHLQQENDQLIFLEYCPGGNLLQYLTTNKQHYHLHDTRYWLALKRIVCELVVTVGYLHSINIIHRDIKLENILLNYTYDDLLELITVDSPQVLPAFTNLTDFGLSKKLRSAEELLSTRCGSQDYISPEILMGLKYNGFLTDSWSIGVLLYSIIENRLPFDLIPVDAANGNGVSPSVLRRKRSRNSSAHRIAMIDWEWFKLNQYMNDENIPEEIKIVFKEIQSVVKVLLVRKDKRMTISQILESQEYQWIRDFVPVDFMLHIKEKL